MTTRDVHIERMKAQLDALNASPAKLSHFLQIHTEESK